ncbi:MAG: hypothetical protein IKI58_10855 [Oscillospiraceae bacterium]|nr:hypothetical protein [Oscillospiraceae bacterium]
MRSPCKPAVFLLTSVTLFCTGCGQRNSGFSAEPSAPEAPPDASTPAELTGIIHEALCRTEPFFTLTLPDAAAHWNLAECTEQASRSSVLAAERLCSVRWKYTDNHLTVQPYYGTDLTVLRKEKADLSRYAAAFALFASDYFPAEQILLAHDRILRECSYTEGASGSAADALLLHKAECGGYAAAFALLAEAVSLPCITVSGTAGGVPHAWNLVELDGAWYHIDCAWDDTDPAEKYRFFLRTDSEMSKTHTWNRAAYPAAEGTAYSYPLIVSGMMRRTQDFREAAQK